MKPMNNKKLPKWVKLAHKDGKMILYVYTTDRDAVLELYDAHWNQCEWVHTDTMKDGDEVVGIVLTLADYDEWYDTCTVCDDPIDMDGYYDEGLCMNHPPDVIAHPCSGIAATQNHEYSLGCSKVVNLDSIRQKLFDHLIWTPGRTIEDCIDQLLHERYDR